MLADAATQLSETISYAAEGKAAVGAIRSTLDRGYDRVAAEAELDYARVNDRSARKGVMLFCRVAFKGAISALDLRPYAKLNFIVLASR